MYFTDASFRWGSSSSALPERRSRRRLPDIFDGPSRRGARARCQNQPKAPMSLPSARLRLLGRATRSGVLTTDRTMKAMRNQVLRCELRSEPPCGSRAHSGPRRTTWTTRARGTCHIPAARVHRHAAGRSRQPDRLPARSHSGRRRLDDRRGRAPLVRPIPGRSGPASVLMVMPGMPIQATQPLVAVRHGDLTPTAKVEPGQRPDHLAVHTDRRLSRRRRRTSRRPGASCTARAPRTPGPCRGRCRPEGPWRCGPGRRTRTSRRRGSPRCR